MEDLSRKKNGSIISDHIASTGTEVEGDQARMGMGVPEIVSRSTTLGITSPNSRAPIATRVEGLIKQAQGLSEADFVRFFKEMLALRARRIADVASLEESEFLSRINLRMPEARRRRYDDLRDKFEAETLTEAEHEELMGLSDELEMDAAERWTAIARLADLQGASPPSLKIKIGPSAGFHV